MEAKTTETWRAVTITLESARAYENPFLDVEIWARFTGPSGQVIRREAYWDGGTTYRVSFAPTEAGSWTYVVEAPAETGLSELTGTLEAVAYSGDLPIYQHGFLRVSADGRYLEYADGTPFFWLGDTHWEFAYGESWDESNHPGMASQFRGMVDLRVAQGFNVYQTNLRSDMGTGPDNYWERTKDGGWLPNVAFYQDELDRRMRYIADAGLVNALGQSWCFALLGEGRAELQIQFARYLVARYGALPMVWTLAGEVAGYDSSVRDRLIAGWRKVALEIERRDGYGQLQTAHYTNERPFASYYQDEEWFDFTLNQAGHGDYLITAADYQQFFDEHPGKPFVEGEALYEFCSTLEEMGTRLCTADMLRRVAYLSVQLGGCGYTYGAQGIWDNVWDKPERPSGFLAIFNRFGVTWSEAVDGEGAVQMGHLREFYEHAGFSDLAPVELEVDRGNLFAKKRPLVTASKEFSRIVAYYCDTARKTLSLDCVPEGSRYEARWFDPREGVYADAGVVECPDGVLELPAKPGLDDWLLLLERS